MSESCLSPVQFHDSILFVINRNNEPYTPMKPIVEGMGLNWASQTAKLNANKERWGIAMIATPSASGDQQTLCMPVRKLPAFMASINPKKVREELRERIRLYQDECDNALWDYWTKGQATRRGWKPGQKALPPSPPAQQFDEAVFLEFAEECRQVHKQVSVLHDRIAIRAASLFIPIRIEFIARARLYGEWHRNNPDAQWESNLFRACREAMTYPSDYLEDYCNPGLMLLGYARALNGK